VKRWLFAPVVLGVGLATPPAATTIAGWSETIPVAGTPSTAVTVTPRPLGCAGDPALSKDVTWAPFTDHPLDAAEFYTVRVNGLKASPVKTPTGYRASISLGLGNLLGSATVTVTVWSGTDWARSSTIILGRTVLSPPLGFACP
jgi:hypothetical protein